MAIPKKQTSKGHLTALDKPPRPSQEANFTAEWLNDQVFPPLEFAVPGLITEGSNILVGPPKAGKSWLSLGIGISVAAGIPALGSIKTDKRPVYHFTLEDGHRRVQSRIEQLHGKVPKGYTYRLKLEEYEVFQIMRDWLYDYGHLKPLIIVDTLGKAVPGGPSSNESAYQRDYRIGAQFKQCVDEYPGSSLLMVHHNRKAESSDFVDSVSGTNGLAGSADTILVLERDRHEDIGTLKVTGRDVDEEEYALVKLDNGGWQIAGADLKEAANEKRLSKVRVNLGDGTRELLDFIEEHGEVSTKECTEHFGNNARQWLSRLTKSSKIVQTRRGYYASPEYVAS